MSNFQNPFSQPATPPTIFQVLSGTVLGIVLTYVAFYAGEIMRWDHILDVALITNLLWLGVGVMIFGWYQQFSARRADR